MLCLCFAFLMYLNTSASGAVHYLMVILITGKGPVLQRKWGKKGTWVLDYKNFYSNHFCSNIAGLS